MIDQQSNDHPEMAEIRKLASHIRLMVQDQSLLKQITILRDGNLAIIVKNRRMIDLISHLLENGMEKQIVALDIYHHYDSSLIDNLKRMKQLNHLRIQTIKNKGKNWNEITDTLMKTINSLSNLRRLILYGRMWKDTNDGNYNLDKLHNLEYLQLLSEPAMNMERWIGELHNLRFLNIQPNYRNKQFPTVFYDMESLKALSLLQSPQLLNSRRQPKGLNPKRSERLFERLVYFTIFRVTIKGNYQDLQSWLRKEYGRSDHRMKHIKSRFELSEIVPWSELWND